MKIEFTSLCCALGQGTATLGFEHKQAHHSTLTEKEGLTLRLENTAYHNSASAVLTKADAKALAAALNTMADEITP